MLERWPEQNTSKDVSAYPRKLGVRSLRGSHQKNELFQTKAQTLKHTQRETLIAALTKLACLRNWCWLE